MTNKQIPEDTSEENLPELDSYFVKAAFILAIIALCITIIFLPSCKALERKKIDKAYNVVSVDVNPSERNKQILLNKCQTTYPIAAPSITETVQIDTNEIDTNAGIIREIISSNCPDVVNVDSLTEVIRASIKPIIIEHSTTKEIDRGDSYAIKNVLAQKLEVEKQKAEVEKANDLLLNQNTLKDSEIKSLKTKNILHLIGFGIILLLYIFKVYITKKLI